LNIRKEETTVKFKSRRWPRMLATLGALVAAAGADSIFSQTPEAAKAAQESSRSPAVREELILQGAREQFKEVYYSRSSRRLVTIQSHGGKETLSGVAGAGEYDSIGRGEFSPDGLHIAFMAMRNKRLFVLLDGKEIGDHENVENIDELTLSPDGQRVAFYAWKDKQWVLVVDGKEGPTSRGLRDSSPSIFGFSPDSRRLAYVIDLGRNKFHLVVDNVRTECRGVIEFLFSPDSQHWAATVRRGFLGRPVVLFDGQELSFKVDVGALQFNPATGKVAVIGLEEGWHDKFVVAEVHAIQLPKNYKYTLEISAGGINFGFYGPYFSADGKHDVYAIHDSKGEDVFADGEIVFSTRITGLTFFKWKVTRWRLEGLALSGDGRHLAVVASSKDRVGISLVQMGEDPATGRWVALGRREIELPASDLLQVSNLLLSPAGQHLAFHVSAKKYDSLVVDGEEGPHYENVKDLATRRVFLGLQRDCFFETEDSVTCVAAKANGMYRVTQTAPSTSPWPAPAKH
jgi:hypothetical protein